MWNIACASRCSTSSTYFTFLCFSSGKVDEDHNGTIDLLEHSTQMVDDFSTFLTISLLPTWWFWHGKHWYCKFGVAVIAYHRRFQSFLGYAAMKCKAHLRSIEFLEWIITFFTECNVMHVTASYDLMVHSCFKQNNVKNVKNAKNVKTYVKRFHQGSPSGICVWIHLEEAQEQFQFLRREGHRIKHHQTREGTYVKALKEFGLDMFGMFDVTSRGAR